MPSLTLVQGNLALLQGNLERMLSRTPFINHCFDKLIGGKGLEDLSGFVPLLSKFTVCDKRHDR